ncbi:hypothetical protein BKA59DRAFT_450130 [Fusarium tricinctum]|uniref:Uncharacterized protein n=1 Tax=Fusarium tricinctum TaxID=61284 RepID=A0A8K0WEB7_9HYPO|nr:hypothetical protein BKA59DRAFT_450130 [Fusarium tricinctum]
MNAYDYGIMLHIQDYIYYKLEKCNLMKLGSKASLVRGNLEDDASDDDGLLSHEKDAKKSSLDSQRHWVLLGTPTSCKLDDNSALRLPHAGWIEPAIQMELRTYDDKFKNHGAFRGLHRPKLDEAWGEILRNSPITLVDYTLRIPKPGWRNATSPEIILNELQDDRGGIMGTFSFLHNIHYIKEIQELLLPDYYPATAKNYKPTAEEPIPVYIVFVSLNYIT